MAKKKATKKAAKASGGTKVKNKDEEIEARSAVDQANQATILGRYEKKLEIAKKARDFVAQEYFQKEFKSRQSAVDGAYKRLQDACKGKAHKLETKEDLKPYTEAMNDLKNAVARLDEWTYPARRDCLELETFMNHYTDAPLFEKHMTQIAKWNHDQGRVEITKR